MRISNRVLQILSVIKRSIRAIGQFYKYIFIKIMELRLYAVGLIKEKKYFKGLSLLFLWYFCLLGYIAYTIAMGIIVLIYAGPAALILYLICRFSGVCIV
jgi:hypothetical protein